MSAFALPACVFCCSVATSIRAADGIEAYRETAARIIAEARAGNRAYDKLVELCDDVGHRLAGSPGYDKAVEWAMRTLKADGHENVRGEPAMVPRWVRGRESLRMIEPYERDLPMLGLGMSIGTPREGITAEVLVINEPDELEQRSEEAAGKIVLFNIPMTTDGLQRGRGYGPAVRFRVMGANLASRHGAVAALVRSVTTNSLQTPHTGALSYGNAERPIPAAAITTEYANMFARMQARGIPIRVQLRMEAYTHPELVPNDNVIGELVGRERPEEIVIISGHLDSWDVGQGAQDDGAGCVTAMEALTLLRKLDLRPRRTIRVVLWANEENGIYGARDYVRRHEDAMKDHVAAIESDSGMGTLLAFGLEALDETVQDRAHAQMTEIIKLMSPLKLDIKSETGYSGADIRQLRSHGVPLIGQEPDMTRYFDYHHTEADTVDTVSADDLTDHVAAMAIMAYVIADMPGRFGNGE